MLGNGGATAFWDIAAYGVVSERSLHLSFGEFSSKFAKVIAGAPWLADPVLIESAPGSHPQPRAEAGVDTYALTHNETSTGVAMPDPPGARGRPGRAGRRGRHQRGGRAAGRHRRDRRLLLRAAEVLRLRRRPVDRADLPAALARAAGIAASGRYIPGFLSLSLAIDSSAKLQTYNTPSVATLLPARRAGGVDARPGRPGLGHGPDGGLVLAPVHLGGEVAVRDPVRGRPGPAVAGGGHDRLRRHGGRGRGSRPTLRANGIVDTEPYRTLGRNQLRIGMFPSVDPADVEALTACIDYVVERLQRLLGAGHGPGQCSSGPDEHAQHEQREHRREQPARRAVHSRQPTG